MAKKSLNLEVNQEVLDTLEALKAIGFPKAGIIESSIHNMNLSLKITGRWFLWSKGSWDTTKEAVVRHDLVKSQFEYARKNGASLEDLAKFDDALAALEKNLKRLEEKGDKP